MITKKRRFVAAAFAAAAVVTSLGTVSGAANADNASAINRKRDPFSSATKFCVKDTKKYSPKAIADGTKGYSETEINVGSLITDFNTLKKLGRTTPNLDYPALQQTFIDYVNNECGGVRGRKVVLTYPTISLAPATIAQQGQELWTKVQPVAGYSTTGNAGAPVEYLVKERGVTWFGSEGGDLALAKTGNFFTYSYPAEVGVKMLGDAIVKLKLLKSTDKVAIMGFASAAFDWTAAAKPVLAPFLKKAGVPDANIEWSTTSCLPNAAGATICTGINEAVAKYKAMGANKYIQIAVPPTNIIDYYKVYADAGWNFEVGYGTSLNNASSSDNQSHSVCVASLAACQSISKVHWIDTLITGPHRYATTKQWAKKDPFTAMCAKLVNDYTKNTKGVWSSDPTKVNTMNLAVDMNNQKGVFATCMYTRYMLQAIWRAGENPTRQEIGKAARSLGDMDGWFLADTNLRPGKNWTGGRTLFKKIAYVEEGGKALCPKTRGYQDMFDPDKGVKLAGCFVDDKAMNKKLAAAGGISINYTLAALK